MGKREQRHDAIRRIVREGGVRTQRDLLERLQVLGHDCTQATVSRDIAELGLLKDAAGGYVLPCDQRLALLAVQMVERVDASGNLVVVHTYAGSAASVAGAIDEAGIDGALGCVAGDDTILLAAAGEEAARSIAAHLEALRRR